MDKIAVVDFLDNTINFDSKQNIHKKGVLHGAFSVFLYHDNKVLLQCRAKEKYHSGGLIANTCCSHKIVGSDLISCAKQRLKEEVGIEVEDLCDIGSFVYYNKFNDDLFEYELDHVLVGVSNQDSIINKNEVMWAKWFDIEDIKKDLIENPKKYCAWFFNAFYIFLNFINKK